MYLFDDQFRKEDAEKAARIAANQLEKDAVIDRKLEAAFYGYDPRTALPETREMLIEELNARNRSNKGKKTPGQTTSGGLLVSTGVARKKNPCGAGAI